MRSSLSRAFTRLWTWRALVALYRKRSMKCSVRATCRDCWAAAARCMANCSSRATTKSAKPPTYSVIRFPASSRIRLATASMKSRSWLTNSRPPDQPARCCSSQATLSTSRWLVGSSMINRSGADSSSRARATRMRHPPDISSMGRSWSAGSKPRPDRIRWASASTA